MPGKIDGYRKIGQLQQAGFDRIMLLGKEPVIINGGLDRISVYIKGSEKYSESMERLREALNDVLNEGRYEKLQNIFRKGDSVALCFDKSEEVFFAYQF